VSQHWKCACIVCSYQYFCWVRLLKSIRNTCSAEISFSATLLQIENGKFILSSAEEAKEGENLGDLLVDRRIKLSIYSINGQVEVLERESFGSGEVRRQEHNETSVGRICLEKDVWLFKINISALDRKNKSMKDKESYRRPGPDSN